MSQTPDSKNATLTEVVFELIAVRVPEGDRWRLVSPDGRPISDTIIDGIVEAMSTYMRTHNYMGDYKLAPRDQGGRIYIIKEVQVELPKEAPKRYDLYGEF